MRVDAAAGPVDRRSGKAVRLSIDAGSMDDSLLKSLDTRSILDRLQSHLAWGEAGKCNHGH
jgi:hypothetical protein